MRHSPKLISLLALGALAVIAAGVYLHQTGGEDDVVPAAYRHAITQTELAQAERKLNGSTPVDSGQAQTGQVLLKPNQTVRLAIGGLGLRDEGQNRQLADLVTAELSQAPGIELVERQSIDRVLREQELSLSGLVRAKDALRVGRLLKADWFLFGTTAQANGTNATVARLVSARTGVLLDAGVLVQRGGMKALAHALAGFAQESRRNATEPRTRCYLALGALEDLSVNNRQADFPNQLRGYLTAAFRNTSIVLLEREYVEALLQELQLDMAGLTQESAATGQTMPSACWLVSGCYQSYENEALQVEVALNLHQILGWRLPPLNFRAEVGEPLFRDIANAISTQIKEHATVQVPTHRTEVQTQMQIGKDLLRAGHPTVVPDFYMNLLFTEQADDRLSQSERLRRRQNLQEAIKAFQAALLLAPTNREAKLCLAECLQNPAMGNREAARESYRKLLEESTEDTWANYARGGLEHSFDGLEPAEQAQWFAQAATRTGSPKAKAYFERQALKESQYSQFLEDRDSGKASPSSPPDLATLKARLLVDLQDPHYGPAAAMSPFVLAYGTNVAAAAHALVELLPELQAACPDKGPLLTAAVISLQVDTNTSLIPEFQKTLEAYALHPEQLRAPAGFWDEMRGVLLPWCYRLHAYGLAETIVRQHYQSRPTDAPYLEDERLVLALEYFNQQQWQNALRLLQCYSNRPVRVRALSSNRLLGPVLTGRYAEYCAQQLGLQPTRDPREFQLGKPCLALGRAAAFALDSTGLWVGDAAKIRRFDLSLQLEKESPLPVDSPAAITCLCSDEACLWVGTAGNGLLQFQKQAAQWRRWSLKDGLLMDSLSQLHLTGGTLWLGFSAQAAGGLGKLDLASQQLQGFTPALNTAGPNLTLDPTNGPPRHPVLALTTQDNGDVLAVISTKGLQRFSPPSHRWETLPNPHGFTVNTVAAGGNCLVEGVTIPQFEVSIEPAPAPGSATPRPSPTYQVVSLEQLAGVRAASATNALGQRNRVRVSSGIIPDQGGLDVCTLPGAHWATLRDANGIPNPPGVLKLAEDQLWVGGECYVACIDLKQGQVVGFAYAPGSVRNLQVCAGYLWAQLDDQLYRVPLTEIPNGLASTRR